MNGTQLLFGVWNPKTIINAAKRYTAVTTSPAAAMVPVSGLQGFGIGTVQNSAAVPPTMVTVRPRETMPSSGGNGGAALFLGAIAGVLLVLVALRAGAGWYIGKQFGRPKSGALVGGIFGAPGLGVLSLFPGGRR